MSYFDLEKLIEIFENKLNNLPVNENGKHIIEMETVIEYLRHLVDDDDFLD